MTLQIDGSHAARDRYTRVAIALHWMIAAFIIFNLCTGFFMEGWPLPIRFVALMLHASSGMTVLALTVVRVVWRLINEPPPYPAGMRPWERHTAHFAHFLLYAAMVLMPLTGWAILSAHSPPGSHGAAVEYAGPAGAPPGMMPGVAPAGAAPAQPSGAPPMMKGPPPPLKIWSVIQMPMIGPIEAIGAEPGGVAAQRVLHKEFVDWHSVGGYILLGLLILHILGALKHQFIDKHAEFARMEIGGRKRS
jgi:cytochrome b561